MSFLETPRFPENISYGAAGGPGFKTNVVIINSGYEQRNIAWSVARASYDVAHAARSAASLYSLIHFFRSVKGRAHGFRFKDWSDYTVSSSEGILDAGVGDGYATYQLVKQYASGALSETREIKKPVAGTVTVYRNGSPVTAGAGAGQYALDTTTGIVTFVADSTKSINANSAKTITAITQANPGQVTATGHGFVTGDKIKLTSVGGMTEVNGNYYTITYVDADNFTIGVDTTGYTAYTSGGTATKYGLTQTSPVRVYATAHGFTNGQEVYISGVSGMTEVNGLTFTVANAGTDYFDLSGIDGTTYTARTSGGTISLFPQASDTLTWAGEFDVPVRFDTDQIKVELIAPDVQGWQQIPLVEIRV